MPKPQITPVQFLPGMEGSPVLKMLTRCTSTEGMFTEPRVTRIAWLY